MKFPKKLFLLSMSLFLFACLSEPQVQDSAEGEVAEVEEIQYRTEQIQEFLLSEVVIYFPDGKVDSRRVYQYDEQGNMLSMELFSAEDLMLLKTQMEYLNGVKVKETLYDQSGVVSFTEYKYLDGKLSEESYLNAQERYVSGSRYSFNQLGQRELWISLNEEQVPVMKTRYTYEEDNLVRLDFMTPYDEPDGHTIYNYENGNLVEEISYNRNGDVEKKLQYIYEEGLMVEEKTYFGTRLSRNSNNTFDENGQLLRRDVYNRNGRQLQYEDYSYIVITKEIQVPVE